MAGPLSRVSEFAALAPQALRLAPHAASGVFARVMEIAIHGYQRFPGAVTYAPKQLDKRDGDVKATVSAVIDQHVRAAGVQGFVTSLGGLVVMPVAMPANLSGLALVQTRMVASIAHLRGYDVDDPRVRLAILTCLLGDSGVKERIKKQTLPTSPLAMATAPVFDPALERQVATEVLAELVSRIGGKRLAVTLSRRIPVLGGGVGMAVDGFGTYQVGKYAERTLIRRIRPTIER